MKPIHGNAISDTGYRRTTAHRAVLVLSFLIAVALFEVNPILADGRGRSGGGFHHGGGSYGHGYWGGRSHFGFSIGLGGFGYYPYYGSDLGWGYGGPFWSSSYYLGSSYSTGAYYPSYGYPGVASALVSPGESVVTANPSGQATSTVKVQASRASQPAQSAMSSANALFGR